ncbi:MAG: rhomboid family intramembrane serine protease [Clostridia bacterium]|nr:rhomboid family intramembrane serine protease [Clostridia bacterium]
MKEKKFREPLLRKMERKMGRYAIRNLMLIIVIITALVWLLDMIIYQRTEMSILYWLMFDREAIFRGEVWRIITFIFIPDEYDLLYLAIGLYLNWLIGDALETEWGSFRFNLFYFCGILGNIVSGLITGFATNYYLNLTMFLAFAILNPEFKLYIFFFIPVKVKWLAVLDAIGLALLFLLGTTMTRIALAMSLVNLALFFGKNVYEKIQNFFRRRR